MIDKDNAILVWKYLRPLLENNEELSQYLDTENNIYQVYAGEDPKTPFIILRRDTVLPQYTKYNPGSCGWTNQVQLSISIYTDNYNEGAYISNIIRDILEGYHIENQYIKIHPIALTSASETFTGSAYEQRLTFTTNVE